MSEKEFSSQEVCAAAGISYRRLDYWTKLGLLSAGEPGSGKPRVFSATDVATAIIVAKLTAAGVDLFALRCAIAEDRLAPFLAELREAAKVAKRWHAPVRVA